MVWTLTKMQNPVKQSDQNYLRILVQESEGLEAILLNSSFTPRGKLWEEDLSFHPIRRLRLNFLLKTYHPVHNLAGIDLKTRSFSLLGGTRRRAHYVHITPPLRLNGVLTHWWSGAYSTGLTVPPKRQSIQEEEEGVLTIEILHLCRSRIVLFFGGKIFSW
jgi:hypothetical protein